MTSWLQGCDQDAALLVAVGLEPALLAGLALDGSLAARLALEQLRRQGATPEIRATARHLYDDLPTFNPPTTSRA